MKNDKGSSTLRFFVEWLVEQAKGHVKAKIAAAVVIAASFSAHTVFPKLFEFNKAPVVNEEASVDGKALGEQEKPDAMKDAGRKPSSISGAIEEPSTPHSRGSGESDSSFDRPQSGGPSAGNSGSNLGGAVASNQNKKFAASGPSEPANSQVPAPSKSNSLKSNDASPDTVGFGGFAQPSPTTSTSGQASVAGNYTPASGKLPSAFLFTSRFQIDSGAQICRGPQMQARVSIGAVLNPGFQVGAGIIFVSGMEGILYGN